MGNITMQEVWILYSATMDGLKNRKQRVKTTSWDCHSSNCNYYQFGSAKYGNLTNKV